MLTIFLGMNFYIQALFLLTFNQIKQAKAINTILSLLSFILFLILFFFKDEKFGADTKNYLSEFSLYCSNPDIYHGVDYTYKYIFDLIYLLMAGSCNPLWIMWIWPIFILSVILSALIYFRVDKIYLVAFFGCFIGIELLTNAMRQGFSVSMLLFSFCFYYRNKYFTSAVLTLISLLFHQASFIIILLFLTAKINYRYFIGCLVIFVAVVFFTPYIDMLYGVSKLKLSIYKYMPYIHEDMLIRAMSLFTLVATGAICLAQLKKAKVKLDSSLKNILFNVLFFCALVSLVPYLGFRIVYGVYPLFLMYCYFKIKESRSGSFIFLSMVSVVNLTISLIWLNGSSHMRTLTFLDIL